MHVQHVTAVLLMLLMHVMAVPVQERRAENPKECPQDTKSLKLQDLPNPICLRPGPTCIDAYADSNFKGNVFNTCAEQDTCVNILHDSGVWGQLSSFKEKGKPSLDDGKSAYSKVACVGWAVDECGGDTYYWLDRWERGVSKQYKENDKMKSYMCFDPIDWPWGRPNNAAPLSNQK